MAVSNSEIAAIFNEIADLLEIAGENPFRVRAYRNAARTVEGYSRSMAEMLAAGEDLEELPTIGEDLAGKIREIVDTGRLRKLQRLERGVSPALAGMLRLPGLGPKRVKVLHERLGINTQEELEHAAEQGKIRELPGFGAKTEAKILEAIRRHAGQERRFLWHEAESLGKELLHHLEQARAVRDVVIAGSFRRRQETVGDLDILVTAGKGTDVIQCLHDYDRVERVVSSGETRSTVILRMGLQVDLRVVPAVSFGAALHYFTGCKAHNIAIRTLGVRKGLKINEYGVFRGERRVAGKSEASVYAQVGLPYIEPELRENQGEIEAAQKKTLPDLVTEADILGDLHMHTTASDGHDSLEAMARAAQRRGYAYIAITEHSQRLKVARGLTAERLRKQCDVIDRLNDKLRGLRVLKGMEVDILDDGSLDMPDDVLERLDVCVGAIHAGFNLSRKKQTERILRAMDNPHFNILAHPTGRLIGRRDAYELDLERVLRAAKSSGCAIELNAQPERLDLDDSACRLARSIGVPLAISTDAHSTAQLDYMRFGVAQARRGWLEKADVLNSRKLHSLLKFMQR